MHQGPLDADSFARVAAEDHAASRTEALERLKFQMSIADAAMKALMLANGGAMVALFTFIGNLIAKAATAGIMLSSVPLWTAFALFVGGLVAALLCHIFAFLSQDRFYNQAMREAWRAQDAAVRRIPTAVAPVEFKLYRQGTVFYVIGILLSLVSVVCFATGCGFALSGVLIR